MENKKVKIKILGENKSIVKVKFPYLEIPVTITKRYFQKLIQSSKYIIEGVNYAS